MMKTLNSIHTVLTRISIVFAGIATVAIAFMMFGITADVVIRWVSDGTIQGIYELTEAAMGIAVFGTLAYTQTQHGHVHVTLLIGRFGPKSKMLTYAITSLFTTIVAFVISYAAVLQLFSTMEQNKMTSVLHIPFFPFYGFEALGMFLFGVTLLFDTIRCFIAVFNRPLATEIESTWT